MATTDSQLVIQSITWVIVVAGWVIVHYLTVTRERQKEIRELKSRLIDQAYDIENRAIAFHRAPEFNPDEARSLVAQIERVSSAMHRRPISILAIEPIKITQFRRSITLRNFDRSSFTTQHDGSDILNNIALRAEHLVTALDEAYADRYLDRWWQTFRI